MMNYVILNKVLRAYQKTGYNLNIFSRNLSSMSNTIHQKISGRKRFYKEVDVNNIIEKSSGKSLFQITLDGKVLRTPARKPLQLPSIEIALVIAAEWDAQIDDRRGIEPPTMPITQLIFTAIDQIEENPEVTRATCLSYLSTDTALFFAPDEERILLGKQKQYLSPLLRWIQRKFDVKINHEQGRVLKKITHDPETVGRIEAVVNQLDPITLAALQSVTMECKSLLMALAFLFRYCSLDQLKIMSRLEEEFQVEIWGVVEGGHDMDRLNNSIALSSANTLMHLYWNKDEFEKIIRQCSIK